MIEGKTLLLKIEGEDPIINELNDWGKTLVWHSQPQALPELQRKGLVTHNTSTCSRPKFFIYII